MDVLHEHKCCDGRLVYKGAWTQEEDERLIVYMQSRGDRKQPWKDVPRSAGLARCGKSCRFRWLHYLRPSLNRTEFSTDEIDTIHNLRSSVGNKWSEIAKFLPGRSDNSIKNFWNTYSRKLPIRRNQASAVQQVPAVNLHRQPTLFMNSMNSSVTTTTTVASSSMNRTRNQRHGGSIYDRHGGSIYDHRGGSIYDHRGATSSSVHRNLNIGHPLAPMIPTFESRTGNQGFIMREDAFTGYDGVTHDHLPTQFLPSSSFGTSSITHRSNSLDDFLSSIEYDLPLPGSFPSPIINQSPVPTWGIGSNSTNDHHGILYEGNNSNSSNYNSDHASLRASPSSRLFDYVMSSAIRSSDWMDPIFFNDQTLEQPNYHHESNYLYEPSLFGSESYNYHQMMGHSVIGDGSGDRGNHGTVRSGNNLNASVYQSDDDYFGTILGEEEEEWRLHFSMPSWEDYSLDPIMPSNHEYINHGDNF